MSTDPSTGATPAVSSYDEPEPPRSKSNAPNAFAPNQGLGGGYGGNDVRYGGNQMSPSHQYEQQRPPMSNGGGGGYGQPRGGQPPRPGARAPFAGDGDQDELLAQLERDLYGR